MKNLIEVTKYHHVDSVVVNGLELKSSYNYNFYVNDDDNGDVILEICDDDCGFDYTRITDVFVRTSMSGEMFNDYKGTYLGSLPRCVWGIFPMSNGELPDDIEIIDGKVELDTEYC